MRIACFICGDAPTGPASALRKWAKGRGGVTLFHDLRYSEGNSLHYLNFYRLQRRQPFDCHFYFLENRRSSAALYPFIVRYPGVVCLELDDMRNFLAGISFSHDDPAGSGHLLERAGVTPGTENYRLFRLGLGWGGNDFGRRIAARIAGFGDRVVVFDQQVAFRLQLAGLHEAVSVLPLEELEGTLHDLLIWQAAEQPANEQAAADRSAALAVLTDFAEQQQQMIRGQFFKRHWSMAQPALVAFDELFDNSKHQTRERSARE